MKTTRHLLPFLLLATAGLHTTSLWERDKSMFEARPWKAGDIIQVQVIMTDKLAMTGKNESTRGGSTDLKSFGEKEAPPPSGAAASVPVARDTAAASASLVATSAAPKQDNPLAVFPFLPEMRYAYSTKAALERKSENGIALKSNLAAQIKTVNADGTLVIEGTSALTVNGTAQTVTLRGTIAADDIRDRIISGSRIANLQLAVNAVPVRAGKPLGKGDLPADLQTLPAGKLQLLLDYLNALSDNLYR